MKKRDLLFDGVLLCLFGYMLVGSVVDGEAALAAGAGVVFGVLIATVVVKVGLAHALRKPE